MNAAARPLVSVVVPTHNRPDLLPRAVASALAQTAPGPVEVVVVDDGSTPPAHLAPAPRLRLLRHDAPRGGAAARNTGLEAARGAWVVFLDDDDELLEGMVARSLEAVDAAALPAPVAAVSTLEVVDGDGRRRELRRPPSLPRGALWNLEPLPDDRTPLVKQSLLAPRDTLRAIGGFDAELRSRVHSDLFLRLNPICSIVGVEAPGYRLYRHDAPRVSTDARLRRESFRQLVDKHGATLRQRPQAYARLLLQHVQHCRRLGRPLAAAGWLAIACRHDPRVLARPLRRLLRTARAGRGAPAA